MLADLVRTDRHQYRPVAADSTLAEAVKVLARAHQSLTWTRQRQINQLRSTLREFYPQALANRLVGILDGCLKHHTPYDESIAWAHTLTQAA